MSYFDDASLVFIPSGYKTSKAYSVKPIDGSGDLTFTRSNDTATRVNSAGLIEKVRTNLLLQSNTFSTTWTASNASVTSGQAGYDGTNNAWLLSKSAANGYISQGPASSGSETISVYAKAGTDNWLHILVRDSASVFFGGYWDLQNGVVGSAIGATTLRIQSVGNGWYRCSASFVKSTSNYYRIYPAEGNNDTSGTSGNILIQAAQLETGDIATQPILTTTAAVSVGPVANVPRLDYLNSSCPRLLLEPQRTNTLNYSEQFNNAAWTKLDTSVTANAGVSPDGYTNADKIVPNTTSTRHILYQSITTSNTYTFSVFAKAAGQNFLTMRLDDDFPEINVFFNLSTGTIGATAGGSPTMTSYGNGWYRCSVTYTPSGTETIYAVLGSANVNGSISYAGNGTDGVLIYGAQLEAGAYATSYIPTLGAAVTRGADAASKTGISSLIGSTEGVLFIEADIELNSATGRVFIDVNDNNLTNRVLINISNNVVGGFVSGSTRVSYTIPAAGRYKIAFAYKSGDFALYVNGVQRSVSSASVSFSGMNQLFLGHTFNTNDTQPVDGIKSALVFKTRLSNADLAALTA